MNSRQRKKHIKKHGCDYCTEMKSLHWDEESQYFIREVCVQLDGSIDVMNLNGDGISFDINYCPMCGRDVSKLH